MRIGLFWQQNTAISNQISRELLGIALFGVNLATPPKVVDVAFANIICCEYLGVYSVDNDLILAKSRQRPKNDDAVIGCR